MTEKDPKIRISAKEALLHPWFTMECTGSNALSITKENINKYCNEGYFDVENIKPEFNVIRYCPLLDPQDSDINDMSLGSTLSQKHDMSTVATNISHEQGKTPHELRDNSKKMCNNKIDLLNEANCTLHMNCRDGSDFDEDDISEKADTHINKVCYPINKSIAYSGVHNFSNSPLGRNNEPKKISLFRKSIVYEIPKDNGLFKDPELNVSEGDDCNDMDESIAGIDNINPNRKNNDISPIRSLKPHVLDKNKWNSHANSKVPYKKTSLYC